MLLFSVNIQAKIQTIFSNQKKMLEALLARISIEQDSICFATLIFTHHQVAQALAEKHRQGVLVRDIVDDLSEKKCGHQVDYLYSMGIDISVARYKFGRSMHHKFLLFGQKEVWTGSANLTRAALQGGQDENMLIITDDHGLVEEYKREFDMVVDRCKQGSK